MKTKIFYPSSVYVKEPQKGPKGLASYIKSKYLAEKICNAKPNKKIVSFYRIPKIQSKSNYNLLGFYEGQKLSVFDKYINQFLKSTLCKKNFIDIRCIKTMKILKKTF